MGRGRGFCWTPAFSKSLQAKPSNLLFNTQLLKSWSDLPWRYACIGGGRLLCSTWLNAELWMFYEEEGKNSERVWFPVDAELLIPSETCAADRWQVAWGTAFSYTGGGGRVIWKSVKEIHVWVCAKWFRCLYRGCVLLSVFGLSDAALRKCFWFQWEFQGNKVVLALRAGESCRFLLLSVLLCKWMFESGSVKNKFVFCFHFLVRCVTVRSAEECERGCASWAFA